MFSNNSHLQKIILGYSFKSTTYFTDGCTDLPRVAIEPNWVQLLLEVGSIPDFLRKVRKKANIIKRYNQVSHLTQDTTLESNKNTLGPIASGGGVHTRFSKESKKEGKHHKTIQSSITSDPGHHIGKQQKHKKTSHTREPRRQPLPAGDHKAAKNRQ